MELVAQLGMGVMQVLTHPHEGLIESQSSFDADYGEIQSIRQTQLDTLLAAFDQPFKHKAGKKESKGAHANQQDWGVKATARDHQRESEDGGCQTAANVNRHVTRFPIARLDQPAPGA